MPVSLKIQVNPLLMVVLFPGKTILILLVRVIIFFCFCFLCHLIRHSYV